MILGDLVSDVIFSDESKLPISFAKETLSGPPPDYFAQQGIGGAAYLQILHKILHEESQQSISNLPSWHECTIPIPKEDLKSGVSLPDLNHWTVAKRPLALSNISDSDKVYRAIERTGKQASSPASGSKERLSSPFPQDPDFLVISDYNRKIRFTPSWSEPEYQALLARTPISTDEGEIPRNVILLGNRLPNFCVPRNGPEPLWDELSGLSKEKKASTMVVTSLDRLRREGANISKRQSWDDTLLNFQRELEEFSPLKKLAEFGHLVVRTGLVGALYVKRIDEGHQTFFFYDPNAEQVVYRDRALQGTAFALRSILPATIATELFLASRKLGKYKETRSRIGEKAIRSAIVDGIAISQKIFTAGFGQTREEVTKYLTDIEYREDYLRKLVVSARAMSCGIEPSTATPPTLPKKRWFVHISCPPKYPKATVSKVSPRTLLRKAPSDKEESDLRNRFRRWNLLSDNLRATVKESALLSPLTKEAEKESALERLTKLETLRRLRLARAIVYYGLERSVNNYPPYPGALRNGRVHAEYLESAIEIEENYDRTFRKRLLGEMTEIDLVSSLVPEVSEDYMKEGYSLPLNTPTAVFGKLKVVGRADIINYSVIRNLITSHLSSGFQKPLNIAAFGAPGSGKSFGIVEISKAIAGANIEIIETNLSQIENKAELNPIFFRISEAILNGRTPLVFFDEFDSDSYRWVKFFLSPMQDGKFRHPDGIVELGNSIFVFAGGVNSDFAKFQKICVGKTEEHGIDPAVAKLPDFLSRLKGFVDIPGLNLADETLRSRYSEPADVKSIPYIRRALILRGALEADHKGLNSLGVCQMDPNVTDAFLRAGYYHHGARSMLSILNMCVRWDGRISKASLPSPGQMNIHTDGKDFAELVRHAEQIHPENDVERSKGVMEDINKQAIYGSLSEIQEAI